MFHSELLYSSLSTITHHYHSQMSFSNNPIVIDGKGHLLGRLASIVSKQVSTVVSRGRGLERIDGGCSGVRFSTSRKMGSLEDGVMGSW